MRRARVAYRGAVHHVTVEEAGLRLADGRLVAEAEVMWLPPTEARTIVALGLNYADHARELDFKPPEEPLVFLKGPNSLVGHNAKTWRPDEIDNMHYECELAVVIGRTASRVRRGEAYDYVGGYTVANDHAIREYLENYYRPNLKVKGRDGATPVGPWVVDRDDVADPMNLKLQTRVNGTVTQEGTTADMIFDVPFLIEYLTEFMTLQAGDLILTGTPTGVVKLAAGDVVETEVEGIGLLRNTLISDKEFFA